MQRPTCRLPLRLLHHLGPLRRATRQAMRHPRAVAREPTQANPGPRLHPRHRHHSVTQSRHRRRGALLTVILPTQTRRLSPALKITYILSCSCLVPCFMKEFLNQQLRNVCRLFQAEKNTQLMNKRNERVKTNAWRRRRTSGWSAMSSRTRAPTSAVRRAGSSACPPPH